MLKTQNLMVAALALVTAVLRGRDGLVKIGANR